MPEPLVHYAAGRVATLTLNRPDAHNALTPGLLDAAGEALRDANQDPGVRVLVLAGSGRSFCAGADLKATPAATSADVFETYRRVHDGYGAFILALRRSPKPVIAAVHGPAVGAGMSLALAADLCVAARSARFGQVFSKVGLCPDLGSSFFLPRAIGTARARELMLFGELIDAAEGERLGFVNRVFDDDGFEAAALAYAEKLAQGAPLAHAAVKRLLDRAHTTSLEALLQEETLAQSLLRLTADHAEGVAAFRGKRPPDFTGR